MRPVNCKICGKFVTDLDDPSYFSGASFVVPDVCEEHSEKAITRKAAKLQRKMKAIQKKLLDSHSVEERNSLAADQNKSAFDMSEEAKQRYSQELLAEARTWLESTFKDPFEEWWNEYRGDLGPDPDLDPNPIVTWLEMKEYCREAFEAGRESNDGI